jgi:UDP-glucose 4-epimerase
MKALVTGGAGFIGSHIVDTLLQHGYDVTVIDDLSTGNEKNINPKADFIHGSITEEHIWNRLSGFETLVHFAAKTSVVESVKKPAYYFDQNCTPTKMIGEWCVRNNLQRVFYANSAGTMYGNSGDVGHTEDATPRPISPYSATKYISELYLMTLPLNVVSLRFANVYGERQSSKGEAGVIPIFTDRIREGQPCYIFGTNKTRDYVHVSDVCKIASKLLSKEPTKNVFNVGSGLEIQDIDVYRAVAKHTKCDAAPIFAPHREGELTRIYLDISKAKSELNWEPKISFEEGCARTVFSYLYEIV